MDTEKINLLIAEKVREKATQQNNVPFLTGDLRKSIVVLPEVDGAAVGSNLKYAKAVHDGRPAITIRPKKGKRLFFWTNRKGKKPKPIPKGKELSEQIKEGNIAVAKKVKQPAREGKPFIREAAEQTIEDLSFLDKIIGEEIRKELQRTLHIK